MPLRTTNPAPNWIELEEVDREIDRFSRHSFVWPRFCRMLEGLFHTERVPGRRRQLTLGALIALAIYDLFVVNDYLMTPQILVRSVVVRLALVTPCVLLALVLQGKKRVLVQEVCAVALCALAVGGSLFLQYNRSDANLLQAEPDILFILLAMNTLLRPDFRLSMAGTAFCYLECLLFLVLDARLTLAEQFAIGGCVFWFAVLSLSANYALTREQRHSWLQQLRGRIQHRMLTESNQELLNLSYTDPLTGLPNRAAYDKRLSELWSRACHNREPLAAIMVDIDHFKSINDSFGHLYGDRVLQRVGSLLEQAMRAEADFVSRFGGEEFIVLLPGSTLESGIQVAERIRVLVQVAGSPAPIQGGAPFPPDTRWSTVSCGVASLTPDVNDESSTLIDAADSALYTAKHTGRNRVCANPTEPVPCDEPEVYRLKNRVV